MGGLGGNCFRLTSKAAHPELTEEESLSKNSTTAVAIAIHSMKIKLRNTSCISLPQGFALIVCRKLVWCKAQLLVKGRRHGIASSRHLSKPVSKWFRCTVFFVIYERLLRAVFQAWGVVLPHCLELVAAGCGTTVRFVSWVMRRHCVCWKPTDPNQSWAQKEGEAAASGLARHGLHSTVFHRLCIVVMGMVNDRISALAFGQRLYGSLKYDVQCSKCLSPYYMSPIAVES